MKCIKCSAEKHDSRGIYCAMCAAQLYDIKHNRSPLAFTGRRKVQAKVTIAEIKWK